MDKETKMPILISGLLMTIGVCCCLFSFVYLILNISSFPINFVIILPILVIFIIGYLMIVSGINIICKILENY
jgi:hypothetical protein